MVAPGRFELPSTGPEPVMLDHYTTGLQGLLVLYSLFYVFLVEV